MTNDEICEAIANKQAILLHERSVDWLIMPRLLGLNPDGRYCLVYQPIDTDRGLPQDNIQAGDGWRRTILVGLTYARHATTKAYLRSEKPPINENEAIPQRMWQGISKVLGAG